MSKKIKRVSRYGRTVQIKPIILQPRDAEIMAMVSEFRLLSREQIQRLFDFPCITRVNIRLKKLFDHGYLSRKLVPNLWGNPKILYFLGHRGIEIVSGRLGQNAGVLRKEREILLGQRDLFLNHQLFLNETRITLSLAVNNHPLIKMLGWRKDSDCLIEFLSNQGSRISMRPDSYFCLSYRGKPYPFFLEVDRSTMSNRQMKSKARAYLDYALSGFFEHDFGSKYFRVLIITKTLERLINLKSSIEELTDKIFYFSFKENLCRDPFFDPIWYRAGRQVNLSLLDP